MSFFKKAKTEPVLDPDETVALAMLRRRAGGSTEAEVGYSIFNTDHEKARRVLWRLVALGLAEMTLYSASSPRTYRMKGE